MDLSYFVRLESQRFQRIGPHGSHSGQQLQVCLISDPFTLTTDLWTRSPTIFDHLLTMPDVDQVVATDGILIPTGDFIDVQETAYDFTTEEFIGARLNQTEEYCGTGCTGYDTCFNRKKSYDQSSLAVQLRSKESGIRLRIYTDQQAIQFCRSFTYNI